MNSFPQIFTFSVFHPFTNFTYSPFFLTGNLTSSSAPSVYGQINMMIWHVIVRKRKKQLYKMSMSHHFIKEKITPMVREFISKSYLSS